MTAILIYLAMALDLPQWALKAIDKIRRAYVWRGRKEAKCGHCLVAWGKVTRSKELGGLGISDQKNLGWALRMRWLWLQKTEPNRPWSMFPIQVPEQVGSFFAMAMITVVRDGNSTLFQEDKWLHGQSIKDMAPLLYAVVSKRNTKRRTVVQTLNEHTWLSDARRASSSLGAMWQFLQLCDIIANFNIQPRIEDTHIWRMCSSDRYSTKSAYESMFQGAIQFRPCD
ncbi:hypothetical protein PR202_gb21776 [Eleusine coracana subsp. coracana]|uniref:Uncharacterized protein n=1 Tax=Eleusine coracana subsp. coracana TaxID=191504 RepID=A0AAV5FC02_ELECO|nr:hypothetical protein PR202_gb21776 [Eleusine coracana subsp. coracana]